VAGWRQAVALAMTGEEIEADAAPRSINHKRGIRQQITRSMISFMESIV
jgi:hypothetical protein